LEEKDKEIKELKDDNVNIDQKEKASQENKKAK
jgi:hypothetical protein